MIASVIVDGAGYICVIFLGSAQTDTVQLVSIPFRSIVDAETGSISGNNGVPQMKTSATRASLGGKQTSSAFR
ncbi:hypothetical protein [Oscillibacter sp.]|uniref:hypothetical protein n=1 Tax=Oscillibacter sp. TaxID=1945593 RepID=UPI00289F5D01|nr:hypothetical protein [Oscillibacter sp.]